MDKPWETLNPHEQCQEIARAIGWKHEPRFKGDVSGYWIRPDGRRYITEDLPDFISSLDDCQLVEDEIERRSRQMHYLGHLGDVVGVHRSSWDNRDALIAVCWLLLRATPEQRCQAALRALEES